MSKKEENINVENPETKKKLFSLKNQYFEIGWNDEAFSMKISRKLSIIVLVIVAIIII